MEEQGDGQFTSVRNRAVYCVRNFFPFCTLKTTFSYLLQFCLSCWAKFIFNEPYNPCSPSVYLIDPKPNRTDPKPDKYESKNPYQKSPDRKKAVWTRMCRSTLICYGCFIQIFVPFVDIILLRSIFLFRKIVY